MVWQWVISSRVTRGALERARIGRILINEGNSRLAVYWHPESWKRIQQ